MLDKTTYVHTPSTTMTTVQISGGTYGAMCVQDCKGVVRMGVGTATTAVGARRAAVRNMLTKT